MILVTGVTGFIGSILAIDLIKNGIKVVGVDNLVEDEEVVLKKDRLKNIKSSDANDDFTFISADICRSEQVEQIFHEYNPEYVVNLAAKTGVRKSISDPKPYVETNVLGFMNMLEACKKYKVKHFIYASSSSVYGANTNVPFCPQNSADHPLSVYAATKRSNELMAHSYSHLFKIPSTGLRFFTVYGPWGRPDMALYLFANAIVRGDVVNLFNGGNHTRDFTYVDDIVSNIHKIIFKPPQENPNWDSYKPMCNTSSAPWKVYNLGNSNPIKLLDYVESLEHHLQKKAVIKKLPLQPGDVPATWADMSDFVEDYGESPRTNVFDGVGKFVEWYKEYNNIL